MQICRCKLLRFFLLYSFDSSLTPSTDSNTQSSDIYTLSTNSGSENSKTSSSDNLHTSPALRNPNSQPSSSKLGIGTPRHSADRSNASHKCISEGSVSPQANSSYSGGQSADVYADNQTVINLGKSNSSHKNHDPLQSQIFNPFSK